MKVLRQISPVTDCQPCTATIGFFDGVHKGHRYLIRQVLQYGREYGCTSALITFSRSPRQVVQPGFVPELLTTLDEKIQLLTETGVDECFILDFTKEMASMSAQEFMARVLKERFNVKVLIIGYDHRFGHNRLEGFNDYLAYGKELGIKVVRAEQYIYNKEENVSSSIIRRILKRGEIRQATALLGYYYSLTGIVVEGFHVGRTLNFPTANMQPDDPCKLLPEGGVYAVWVWLDGQRYKGMLNIGTRPTVNNGSNRTIETHILHFSQDIYGRKFTISLVERLRPEKKFNSLRDLQDQLEKDKILCNRLLTVEDTVTKDEKSFGPHIE